MHLEDEIVPLVIEGERIKMTANHPFFTGEDRWVAADDLRLDAGL